MRHELKDLTILIPVRIESIIRLENLQAVIKYLTKYFDVNIYVLEASVYNNGILKSILPQQIKYKYIKDLDPVFYRTKYINMMASCVQTKYLAIWDADVVFPINQVLEALELLRSGIYSFSFPYDGRFLDTSQIIREIFIEYEDIELLQSLHNYMTLPYGNNMKGGAFFANTEKYRESGLENLRFYGWGPEDWERHERWLNFGHTMKSVKGVLFHLSHPRDMNGMHNSVQQKSYTFYEKDLTRYSSKEELKSRFKL